MTLWILRNDYMVAGIYAGLLLEEEELTVLVSWQAAELGMEAESLF